MDVGFTTDPEGSSYIPPKTAAEHDLMGLKLDAVLSRHGSPEYQDREPDCIDPVTDLVASLAAVRGLADAARREADRLILQRPTGYVIGRLLKALDEIVVLSTVEPLS